MGQILGISAPRAARLRDEDSGPSSDPANFTAITTHCSCGLAGSQAPWVITFSLRRPIITGPPRNFLIFGGWTGFAMQCCATSWCGLCKRALCVLGGCSNGGMPLPQVHMLSRRLMNRAHITAEPAYSRCYLRSIPTVSCLQISTSEDDTVEPRGARYHRPMHTASRCA